MTEATPFPVLLGFACAAVAAGLFLMADLIADIVTKERIDERTGSAFEVARRGELRKADALYRWFEPVIDAWSLEISTREHVLRQKVQSQLRTLVDEPPWTPEEFLAVGRLKALIVSLIAGLAIGWAIQATLGILYGYLVGPFVVLAVTWRRAPVALEERAEAVRGGVRARLPFCIDLITLILQSHGTFGEAVETVIRQIPGTTLSRHLATLLVEIERGVPRSRALAGLGERLNMEEVADLVFAVRQGEELGIPLTQVLANQARQMRLRWSQAVEKAAEEAKVKFAGPSTVIMFACMIVIITPWALSVVHEFQRISQ